MNRRTILGALLMSPAAGATVEINVPSVKSYAIEVRSEDGKNFVRLQYDGTVEYTGSPDSASKLFWDSLKKYMQQIGVKMPASSGTDGATE
jgi:hypothetical protein